MLSEEVGDLYQAADGTWWIAWLPVALWIKIGYFRYTINVIWAKWYVTSIFSSKNTVSFYEFVWYWVKTILYHTKHPQFRYMWLFFKKSSFNSPIWQYYVNCFTKKRAKQAYPVLVSPNVFHFAWQTSKTSAPFHIHHSSTFSNSSITIFNALILAYRLSTDSKICQGAYVVLVFWIISLTASSYWSHFSRLRQSSSVIFHCFCGVFCLSLKRSNCVSLSICTQNLMITAPQSCSSFSNSLISL